MPRGDQGDPPACGRTYFHGGESMTKRALRSGMNRSGGGPIGKGGGQFLNANSTVQTLNWCNSCQCLLKASKKRPETSPVELPRLIFHNPSTF